MSVRDSIQQVLEPIYRGEDVVLDLEPDEGLAYTLTSSTFEFAVGVTPESPVGTVTSALVGGSQVTVPSGDTVRVTMDRGITRLLAEGRNRWALTEIVAGERNVVAAGIVDVRKGAGTLPAS